jgi:hypothetical protein
VISLPAWTEPAYKIAGTVVGVGLGAMSAIWEVMVSPMHVTIGGAIVRVPLATLLAIAGNVGLVWFMRTVTGMLSLAVLPGLAWFAVMFAASTKTSEGDLLITGDNWVGVATILLGAVAWAAAAYLLMFRHQRAGTDGPGP